jgi:hypothetical protein
MTETVRTIECVKCDRGYFNRVPVEGGSMHLWVCCKSPEYNPTTADKARIADMERAAAHADPDQMELTL